MGISEASLSDCRDKVSATQRILGTYMVYSRVSILEISLLGSVFPMSVLRIFRSQNFDPEVVIDARKNSVSSMRETRNPRSRTHAAVPRRLCGLQPSAKHHGQGADGQGSGFQCQVDP